VRAQPDVRAWRLPEGASALDRATLAAWKRWAVWVRPVLAAGALMAAGHLAMAVVLGWSRGPFADVRDFAVMVKWTRSALPAAVASCDPSGRCGTVGPSIAAVAWWGIGAQIVAALTGAATAWPVLRQHARPGLLGATAGAAAGLGHIAVSRTVAIAPVGAVAMMVQVAALVALVAPVPLGAFVGHLTARRSAAPSA
jgi:hypothetical protein